MLVKELLRKKILNVFFISFRTHIGTSRASFAIISSNATVIRKIKRQKFQSLVVFSSLDTSELTSSQVSGNRSVLSNNERVSNALLEDDRITGQPSCPLPDFSTSGDKITLLQPLRNFKLNENDDEIFEKPLLVYFPGMDCTGQGIRNQIPNLFESG